MEAEGLFDMKNWNRTIEIRHDESMVQIMMEDNSNLVQAKQCSV